MNQSAILIFFHRMFSSIYYNSNDLFNIIHIKTYVFHIQARYRKNLTDKFEQTQHSLHVQPIDMNNVLLKKFNRTTKHSRNQVRLKKVKTDKK